MYCCMSYYRNYVIKVKLGVASATLLCYNETKQKKITKSEGE